MKNSKISSILICLLMLVVEQPQLAHGQSASACLASKAYEYGFKALPLAGGCLWFHNRLFGYHNYEKRYCKGLFDVSGMEGEKHPIALLASVAVNWIGYFACGYGFCSGAKKSSLVGFACCGGVAAWYRYMGWRADKECQKILDDLKKKGNTFAAQALTYYDLDKAVSRLNYVEVDRLIDIGCWSHEPAGEMPGHIGYARYGGFGVLKYEDPLNSACLLKDGSRMVDLFITKGFKVQARHLCVAQDGDMVDLLVRGYLNQNNSAMPMDGMLVRDFHDEGLRYTGYNNPLHVALSNNRYGVAASLINQGAKLSLHDFIQSSYPDRRDLVENTPDLLEPLVREKYDSSVTMRNANDYGELDPKDINAFIEAVDHADNTKLLKVA